MTRRNEEMNASQIMQSHHDNTFSNKMECIMDPQDRGSPKDGLGPRNAALD